MLLHNLLCSVLENLPCDNSIPRVILFLHKSSYTGLAYAELVKLSAGARLLQVGKQAWYH